ncbi:MAG: hypothetical protein NWF01_03010 [Candidatus Bathyarchaeota archaeon]|nr:hypothetical protein [Candidatus Bathyarchaeota archaeon]
MENISGINNARKTSVSLSRIRTTIGIKSSTKKRLDINRAPGQCYDGFLCQLVDLWEKNKSR